MHVLQFYLLLITPLLAFMLACSAGPKLRTGVPSKVVAPPESPSQSPSLVPPPAEVMPTPEVSPVQCKNDATVDPAPNPADLKFPSGLRPYIGEVVLVYAESGPQYQMRLIAFDDTKQLSVNPLPIGRDSYLLTGIPLVHYTGPGFRYRIELCVAGKFVPAVVTPHFIISTYADVRLALDQPYRGYDFIGATYYLDVGQPAPATRIGLSLGLRWEAPEVVVQADAQHTCTGVGFEVATNYARARTFIQGHEGDGPYPAKELVVGMRYDGNIQSGNANFPGNPGNPDYWNPFPNGSPLSRTVENQGFVEVSDQIRAVNIGVCSGFTAVAGAHMFDGRTGTSSVHSK